MKKIIFIFACIVMMFAYTAATNAADYSEDDRSATYTENGWTVDCYGYIIAYDNMDAVDITIPAKVGGIEVKGLGNEFQLSDMENLQNIYVDENNIAYSSVDGVLFNKEKTRILEYPCKKDNISYTISEGVERIDYAFYNNHILENIYIPESLSEINGIFYSLSNLKNIYVDENNSKYSSIDGVLFNKEKTVLIEYPNGKSSSSYTVPEGVKRIWDAFYKNTVIETVNLPDSLVDIGEYAFNGCSNLKNINFPANLESIGCDSFSYTSLEEVTIPEKSMVGSGAFSGCRNLKKATFLGFSSMGALVFENTPVIIYGYNNTMIQGMAQSYGYNYVVIDPKINSVSAQSSGDKISVAIDSYFTQGADLFAVSYKDGDAVDCKNITDGKTTLNGNADNVKVFCWKSLESMLPLCPVVNQPVQ